MLLQNPKALLSLLLLYSYSSVLQCQDFWIFLSQTAVFILLREHIWRGTWHLAMTSYTAALGVDRKTSLTTEGILASLYPSTAGYCYQFILGHVSVSLWLSFCSSVNISAFENASFLWFLPRNHEFVWPYLCSGKRKKTPKFPPSWNKLK